MPIGVTRAGVRSLLEFEHGLVIETVTVTDIEARNATLWGELISLGEYDEADVTFELALADETLSSADRLGTATFDSPAIFTLDVSDLVPETDYQFRAIATAYHVGLSVSTFQPDFVSADSATLEGNLDQFTYASTFARGDVIEFQTRPVLSVETRTPENVDPDSATLRGELTDFYPET